MLQQDYILRMIEKFAQLVAKIVGLTKGEDFDSAKEVIAKSTDELVGMTPEEVCQQSELKLVGKMLGGKQTLEGRARCFVLVALLNEAGNLRSRLGDEDRSRQFKLKALNILLAVRNFAEEDVVPDFVPKVDDLVAQLKEDGIPPRTLASLMQHYEFIGVFSRAEDCLYELIEIVPDKRPALHLGAAFYHRLLAKSDIELEDGKLPRVELESGLADLERKYASVPSA